MQRKPRAIRLNDEEWEGFMKLLGPNWLRSQINKAMKRENRQPKSKPREDDRA